MTDQLPRPTTSVRFTRDEARVLLGLLDHPSRDGGTNGGGVSDRLVEKIHAQMDVALGDPHDVVDGRSGAELEALRLGRLLEAALLDLAEIVDCLEARTRVDDRPVILVGSAAVTSRSLARRIDELGVGSVIELDPPQRGAHG